ncbi:MULTISPECIES: hypothetical protein [Burkholderia]|uniref:hypothetical protein n=1 Tax=Burkholderia TaxID=32008 RepID=UPI000AAFE855|nr:MULTISPECIES: hypothetical protein [Burkholderia]
MKLAKHFIAVAALTAIYSFALAVAQRNADDLVDAHKTIAFRVGDKACEVKNIFVGDALVRVGQHCEALSEGGSSDAHD